MFRDKNRLIGEVIESARSRIITAMKKAKFARNCFFGAFNG